MWTMTNHLSFFSSSQTIFKQSPENDFIGWKYFTTVDTWMYFITSRIVRNRDDKLFGMGNEEKENNMTNVYGFIERCISFVKPLLWRHRGYSIPIRTSISNWMIFPSLGIQWRNSQFTIDNCFYPAFYMCLKGLIWIPGTKIWRSKQWT